jgi:hypothetical protein
MKNLILIFVFLLIKPSFLPKKITKNIETQDFSALTHGIYFLKINEKRVLKMVKE